SLRSQVGVSQVKRVVRHGTTVVLTFAAAQIALVVAAGYRPWAAFKTAASLQSSLLRLIPRPYPQTVFFDLTDFALGSGWIAVILVALYLIRHQRHLREKQPALVAAGLAQLLVVAVLGLLPGETARVWMFLLPLLMLPVGLELARWTFSARMIVYGS